jgi:transposase
MKTEMTEEELSKLKQIQRNMVGTDCIEVTSILMLHRTLSPHTVSESLGIDVSTVYRYAALYTGGGGGTLMVNRNRGYCGMLSRHEISRLRTELKRNIYTNSRGISSWRKASFGVSYTPQGVVDPLNHVGFTYKKRKKSPVKAVRKSRKPLYPNFRK